MNTFRTLFGLTSLAGCLLLNANPLSSQGGISAMVVDNISTDEQAASIYFTTLAKSTTVCGGSSGQVDSIRVGLIRRGVVRVNSSESKRHGLIRNSCVPIGNDVGIATKVSDIANE
jgi:hypothetical protein